MIVGLRWVVSPDLDTPDVLQFREENGPWQPVPEFLLEDVEDTVAGDGMPPAPP